MLRIVVGADHRGFILKERIVACLRTDGHAVIDVGTDSEAPVDYPDYALAVGEKIIAREADLGILICGSGVGVSVAANKLPGIRAGLVHDPFTARQSREDDNANVLCLGAKVVGEELALDLVRIWLAASFSGADRHVRRLQKLAEIEQRACAQMSR